MRDLRNRLGDFVFGAMDPIRLRAFRMCFSLTLLVYMFDRAQTPYEWLTVQGFHPSMIYQPLQLWRPPLLPTPWVFPFLTLYFGSLLLLIAGWRERAMTWIVFLCTVYVSTADHDSAYSMNKMYMTVFFLMAIAPSPQRLRMDSKDGWWQSGWPVRVLQTNLLLLYFGSGACKVLHGAWFQVDGQWALNPDILWAQVQGVYCTDLAAWMLRTLPRGSWSVFQYSALAFELIGPFLFLSRRLRSIGMAWGIGFQTMVGLTMYKVGFFSAEMLSFYVLFVAPDRLRSIGAWFRGLVGKRTAPAV